MLYNSFVKNSRLPLDYMVVSVERYVDAVLEEQGLHICNLRREERKRKEKKRKVKSRAAKKVVRMHVDRANKGLRRLTQAALYDASKTNRACVRTMRFMTFMSAPNLNVGPP